MLGNSCHKQFQLAVNSFSSSSSYSGFCLNQDSKPIIPSEVEFINKSQLIRFFSKFFALKNCISHFFSVAKLVKFFINSSARFLLRLVIKIFFTPDFISA